MCIFFKHNETKLYTHVLNTSFGHSVPPSLNNIMVLRQLAPSPSFRVPSNYHIQIIQLLQLQRRITLLLYIKQFQIILLMCTNNNICFTYSLMDRFNSSLTLLFTYLFESFICKGECICVACSSSIFKVVNGSEQKLLVTRCSLN